MQIRKVARKTHSSGNDVRNHAIYVSDGSLCSSMYNSIQKFLCPFISKIRNEMISEDITFHVIFHNIKYCFLKHDKFTAEKYE